MEMVITLKHLAKSICIISLFLAWGNAQAAMKLYHQTTAPATCIVGDAWIDTDGVASDRFHTCTATNTWTKNSGSFVVPVASAETLGGVKVGSRLTITDGVLSADVQSGGATAIDDLTDVDTTGKVTGKILKFDSSGNLVVGDDATGSGSVPTGTVNGQVLIWATDAWVASTTPWLTTASLGTGVATSLGIAPDTPGGFLLYSSYADDPELTVDSTPTSGVGYRVPASSWAVKFDADGDGSLTDETWWSTALGLKLDDTQLDDTKGNGDTGFFWSADKVFDQLALRRSISDERESIGWHIKDTDVATAVADGKQGAVIPMSMNGMVLVDVTCRIDDLNSAASGDTTIVLRRVRGATAVDMTSTGITIAYTDYTASDEVVDTANDDVATGDKIFVDVNAVTSPAQKGLGCTAVFANP